MAESKSVAIVPLSGSNYPTWKIQCRMALVKDGLWNIVNGTKTIPAETDADGRAKFLTRKDRALALIVLSVEPSLLYLLGEPEDPCAVWKKLSDQFQKKSWANKLTLRRRLYSLRLKEGDSMQEHIRTVTELFEELAVVGDPVSEEDRVVHLLASLPGSYDMLVTALEANSDVPKMEVVTERLLHEERKQRDRGETESVQPKAMPVTRSKVRCYHCRKLGHFKRDCPLLKRVEESRPKANKASDRTTEEDSEDALLVSHALQAGSAGQWIVDSGATCHMCCNRKLFADFHLLDKPIEVTLGDGHTLEALGRGVVTLNMNLPRGPSRCNLLDVLYVPGLSYNLVSVAKAAERGKITEFTNRTCYIVRPGQRLVARGTRVGSLYYLDCDIDYHASVAQETKETRWHQHFGHLNMQSLQKLARDNLVTGFDFNHTKEAGFCETCVKSKQTRSVFPTSENRATEPLELIHSDVCGKLNTRSLSGAEYFLTFVDDRTHYTWIYVLKKKDEVFNCFLKWKALVEKSSGRKVKIIRTDNGGEYTSNTFQEYLLSEGIRHERTVPKTPEQNGVAERMNRTLVETVRSMLTGARLPQCFWVEALSTAVYLKNRSPTRTLQDMTPFEAWTGKRPAVGHLRVFGCDAYAHIPKDERGKLDPKAKRCILVGYGEVIKGYRLYDPVSGKIIFSRDVVLNEENRGGGLGDRGGLGDGGLGDRGGLGDGGLGDRGGLGDGGLGDGGVPGEKEIELDFSSDNETLSEMRQTEPQSDDTMNDEGLNESLPPPPAVRRSTRQKQAPTYFGWEVNVAVQKPHTVETVLSTPERAHWLNAMEKEMKSLKENNVWDLVELPAGRTPVGSKWVFKVKTDENGRVERYKARLVAQGFKQKFGADYDETFCPVVRLESIRTLVALSVQHSLDLYQIDITTAFLNGQLKEEVFMKQPEGFVAKGQENLVCRLKKSLYGLKQSPRCWNMALDDHLKKSGFVPVESDPCIYRAVDGEQFFIGVYVDDIIMVTKSKTRISEVKQSLASQFDIKDLGRLHHFLGMKVVQNEGSGSVWLGQQVYTESLLRKFGMDNAKAVATPVDVSTKLTKATDADECLHQQEYQSAVGGLLYLAMATRPDIAFAVSNVAKFSAQPTQQHWTAVKRILRYLRGTADYGLAYSPDSSGNCVGYSDADWGGDLDDRKSTSGYVFLISGGAISWKSKKQTCIALSTAEAEYVALAHAGQEAAWLRDLTATLENRSHRSVVIFEDNQSAIAITRNPQYHGRSKHISIKYHFIRNQVNEGVVDLKYCPTQDMVADMLTKGLSKERFTKLRSMAGVVTLQDLNSGNQ